MSHVSNLLDNYRKFISLPWIPGLAAQQRSIFLVYDPSEELKVRLALGDFESATNASGHGWASTETDDWFADWMSAQEYKEAYFEEPDLFSEEQLEPFVQYVADRIIETAGPVTDDPGAVVAFAGAGSLFGLVRVRKITDRVTRRIKGRLVVFFPGNCTDNNFRLLDGYDGWDYMPTLNREIYQTEPTPDSILNEGVVDVVADKDKVLEYELKTFVCSGKYEEGLDKILRGFCENCGREPMPAVWISGFYGSGKSHLLQMLAHLWENKRLPGGAMPRDLAVLPASIKERLAELDTLGKRNGGLRSATGTLRGENSNDMKMAILKTVFRSCGLPESYAEAKFVLWLRNEGVEKDVADKIAASGKDLAGELGHLYVSTRLHNALCEVLPNTFPSARECAGLLKTQFPVANTVSDTDFKKTLREVLAVNGKLPLTLIVMDEVQEYIGENEDRSGTVQSAVQACSKAMDGRLMLVCSGQSALSGVTMLQKMKDRFDIEIHLGETDITTVIREVVLRKKPQFIPKISKVLTDNIGEISRQLAGSDFAYSKDVDGPFLVADYPVLPSRRSFWGRTLQALEREDSDGQLRNLLKANRDFAYENGGLELGNVVPADWFFFRNATRLLNAGVLSREFHQEVMKLYGSTDPDVKLVARACGLVFLINKVAEQDGPRGIRATVETLADLMVSDLSAGSAPLRAKLPALLDSCPALQKIGSEYHVQTKEGAEWSQEFKAQTAALKSMGAADIDAERMVRIRDEWAALGVRTKVPQGQSNTMRDMQLHFNVDIPMAEKNAIALTVKDEWTSSLKNVRSAAAADGINSPHIHVFVPKRNADRVRDLIIQSLAAGRTIGKRPTPSTPEGSDAKKAIESIQQTADSGLRQGLLEPALPKKSKMPRLWRPTGSIPNSGRPTTATGDESGRRPKRATPTPCRQSDTRARPKTTPYARRYSQASVRARPVMNSGSHSARRHTDGQGTQWMARSARSWRAATSSPTALAARWWTSAVLTARQLEPRTSALKRSP